MDRFTKAFAVAAVGAFGSVGSVSLERAAEAAFTGYTVVATNVTSGGQNLVRYEVFANFNGATDTVLNVFNFALVSTNEADAYGGFWHKDNSSYNGGVLSQQYGSWAPQLIGGATTNRPFDSFLLIGGNPTGTNTTNGDPSWNSGGSGSHAGNASGWSRADLVNNPTIGWFNSSPPNNQGRVLITPNTATQVKLGQFMLSQGHGFRAFSLRTAYNNGAGGGVVFVDGTFTFGDADLCPNDPSKMSPGQCGCGVPDTDSDGDGVADCADGTFSELAKATAATPGSGDNFGNAVAISGDRAIVGAPNDTVTSAAQGSATIFRREATGAWVAEATVVRQTTDSALPSP
jgi:hypothetical protein